MPPEQDNPYASPTAAPVKKSADRPSGNRLATALLFAFESWLGTAMTLLLVWEVLVAQQVLPRGSLPILFAILSLISSPVAVAMSIWVWRDRESKWPSFVANSLGILPFIVVLIGVALGVFN